MKRMDELDSPLNTASELEAYIKRLQDLYRDLYLELEWGAEILQQNLSTLPVADPTARKFNYGVMSTTNSRVRAKQVADNLRRAAEASRYSGGQAVKTWRSFVKAFAPEIDAARAQGPHKRPKFKVDE